VRVVETGAPATRAFDDLIGRVLMLERHDQRVIGEHTPQPQPLRAEVVQPTLGQRRHAREALLDDVAQTIEERPRPWRGVAGGEQILALGRDLRIHATARDLIDVTVQENVTTMASERAHGLPGQRIDGTSRAAGSVAVRDAQGAGARPVPWPGHCSGSRVGLHAGFPSRDRTDSSHTTGPPERRSRARDTRAGTLDAARGPWATNGSARLVVRRFLGDFDVVRMALAQAGAQMRTKRAFVRRSSTVATPR
jgi:hypothetical protein